jgi:hypothetical protein
MLNFIKEDSAKSLIQNKKSIFLPTDSALVLAQSDDHVNNFLDYQNEIFYLFSTKHTSKIFDYSKNVPVYIRFLISAFLPGSIIFKLKKDFSDPNSENTMIYQPNNIQTSDFLSSLNFPLKGFIPRNNFNIPFINQEIVSCSENFSETPILEAPSLGLDILPTVLDCTELNSIKIIHPGIVPAKEIQSILPKNIKTQKSYEDSIFNKKQNTAEKIYLSQNINLNNPEITLVIGTKEKLKETFNLGVLTYFRIKQVDNFILLNLGSQTNLEGIAKNLYKNFIQISKMGISKTVILNQNWGKSHWADIINNKINQISTPVFSQKVEKEKEVNSLEELNLALLS